MGKLNCWEIKKCGREDRGLHAEELGICPAATAEQSNGINGGRNAGRHCWRIADTRCDGETFGLAISTIENCGNCEVFQTVIREQGPRFEL